ncbi:MAG: deoxyribonuclease IV [Chloroflexota bacterium]
MRLGAHISAAGGLFKSFKRAEEAGCDSMMVYTKSNRQWKAKPINEEDLTKYKKEAEKYSHIFPVAVHASYLINIASPDDALWEKSYLALKDEFERAALFDLPFITFHPGSYVKSSPEQGLERIAKGLKRLVEETSDSIQGTILCLETMAGQGTNIGAEFEHLGYLLEATDYAPQLGVCFDTCHVFAAGYDIRSPEAYAKTMAEFDNIVGLEHIKCFHFNDSKFDLGEKKDRHQHIGKGLIGTEGFANFVNDPRWKDHPAHLETPKTEKDDDGNETEMDPVNLATLRGLIQ